MGLISKQATQERLFFWKHYIPSKTTTPLTNVHIFHRFIYWSIAASLGQGANTNRELCILFQSLTKATEGCQKFSFLKSFYKIKFLPFLDQIQISFN